MRLVACCAIAVVLCGCAPRSGTWRLANGVLIPPATLKRMQVPLCGSKPKVTPVEALALRGEMLRSEDEGCVPPGTAIQTITRAIEHQPLSAQRAYDARYGPVRDAGHLDLAPGWRLRAITPILKSGRFKLQNTTEPTNPGATIDVKTAGEFLGMETAFYRVAARTDQSGVRIALDSVEAVIDGKTERRAKPLAALFGLPDDARHLRLLYLTRRSNNDHDMAVVGGPTRRSLEEHARCDGTPYCVWVPLGIAVLAQMPVTVNGATVWIPVGTAVRDAVGSRAVPSHLSVLRLWRGKPVPVEGDPDDLWSLTLFGGEHISTAPTSP